MSANRNVILGVGVGFVFGLTVSYLFINTKVISPKILIFYLRFQIFTYNAVFLSELQSPWSRHPYNNLNDQINKDLHDPHDHKDLENATGPTKEVVFHSPEEDAHKNENIVAQELSKNVRILCWVMTGPENHQSKVRTSQTYAVSQKINLTTGTPCKGNMGKEVQ